MVRAMCRVEGEARRKVTGLWRDGGWWMDWTEDSQINNDVPKHCKCSNKRLAGSVLCCVVL